MYSFITTKNIKNLHKIAKQLNVHAQTLTTQYCYCKQLNTVLTNKCTHKYASAHLTTVQQLYNIFAQYNAQTLTQQLQQQVAQAKANANTQCVVYANKSVTSYINVCFFNIKLLNTHTASCTLASEYKNNNDTYLSINTLNAINNAIKQL